MTSPTTILKRLLDGQSLDKHHWQTLLADAPTATLRRCATVMRKRYLANVQLLGRLYKKPVSQAQFESDYFKGYRFFICCENHEGSLEVPRTDPRVRLHFASNITLNMDANPNSITTFILNPTEFLQYLPWQLPSYSILLLKNSDKTSQEQLVRTLSLLRLALPWGTIGIWEGAPAQDIGNLTLVSQDDASEPSILDDEAYRIIRSKYIPCVHQLAPPLLESAVGEYEAQATISLRYLCRIVKDIDTQADLIRFCNHCLYANAPRFPYDFAAQLAAEDERPLPEKPC
ncbi:hypothetical protein [Desulfurispira natronophila]|uniref:Uncharacterized protein n=1 Tax=Desulfurispira natronophila TaxID=682562 RepID=A0A7W8DG16_9BACT|nr:hypothetical protein [Desulfurispira natronophila]MBB5020925.1 hypothetical protein [Desulfurispira natronophila]